MLARVMGWGYKWIARPALFAYGCVMGLGVILLTLLAGKTLLGWFLASIYPIVMGLSWGLLGWFLVWGFANCITPDSLYVTWKQAAKFMGWGLLVLFSLAVVIAALVGGYLVCEAIPILGFMVCIALVFWGVSSLISDAVETGVRRAKP
jgi:hypothetical protein